MALVIASTRPISAGWAPSVSASPTRLQADRSGAHHQAPARSTTRPGRPTPARPWDGIPFKGMPAVVKRTTIDPGAGTARALKVGTGHTLAGRGKGIVTFNTNTPSSRLGRANLRPIHNRPRPR